jgi:hypothetical protein
MAIEDRIFELTGVEVDGTKVIDAIVDEFGIERAVARRLYVKVRTERGTPHRVATREAIARLKEISFL